MSPQILWTYFARDFLVVYHGGSKSARAKTARGQNETSPSGVVSPGKTPKSRCMASSSCWSALNVAGRAHADHAGVLARRLESKEMIESGDAVGAAERDPQGCRYVAQGLSSR